MTGSRSPAVWRLADCDEEEWRAMGCPTMGEALARIKTLEDRLAALELGLRVLANVQAANASACRVRVERPKKVRP